MTLRLPVFLGCFVLACAPFSSADEVTLKDGRVVEGEITLDDGKVVKVKVKGGSLTLDRKDIVGVVKKPTADQEYAQRKARLPPKDAQASLDLAVWCASRKLEAEAIVHFIEAHGLDATLKAASDELEKRDYHLVKGAWQEPDTYYPAQGWQKLNGSWYHPLEYAWHVSEQEVARAKAKLDDNREASRTGQAAANRATSQADAERKKVDGYNTDLALGRQTLLELGSALEAELAAAKTKAGEARSAWEKRPK